MPEPDPTHLGRTKFVTVLRQVGSGLSRVAARHGSSKDNRESGHPRKCRNDLGPPSPSQPYNEREPGHPEQHPRPTGR